MPVHERDLSIVQKIRKYCEEIEEAHRKFGRTYEVFASDVVYKNAVSLCLMQIGELSNHISEDFKAEHSDVPWREIRGMRNVVAHEYGNIDTLIVWETATENMEEIKSFCDKILT